MVRAVLEFKKGDMVWVSLVVVLLCVGFVVATWDSSKAMFHDSEDVKVTIDGEGDMSLQDAIAGGFIGGGMKLGAWTTKNCGQEYTATTDGFVLAYDITTYAVTLNGETPTRTLRSVSSAQRSGQEKQQINMPVKEGDTWKIITDGSDSAVTVYWVPIISSGGSSGGLSCHTVESALSATTTASVTCDSGIMTGGGCYMAPQTTGGAGNENHPDGNGWYCHRAWGGSVRAYARCCE